MQVLSLTLKGFRGIRDGLGRSALSLDFERLADGAQLAAIAGANGRGKSTVMDNMHPYLTMPSRATVGGPGGFSYYDHVYLPESEKDLVWAHAGRSYRSQVVIRLGNRRKTEAFLFIMDEGGQWTPMRQSDGVVSDGKVETYNRCVEAICGSADTFFTSVFSAQGKRQLSTLRNAEIKTLLADLLGQEEIRALGQKAGETARLLKAGLVSIRQESTSLEAEVNRIQQELCALESAPRRAAQTMLARDQAQHKQEALKTQHAALLAEQERCQGNARLRSELQSDRRALIDAGKQTIVDLNAQDQRELTRHDRLMKRVAERIKQQSRRREHVVRTQRQCQEVLLAEPAVQHSIRRLPLAERVLQWRTERLTASRARVQRLAECSADEGMAKKELLAIEREAGRAVLQMEGLVHRHGLSSEVPCAGTDLQGLCQLLGDAREAQALIPSAKVQITRLHGERELALADLAKAQKSKNALGDAPHALLRAERQAESARSRVTKLSVLAAKMGEMAQARAVLEQMEVELEQLGRRSPLQTDLGESDDEHAERLQIVEARRVISEQLASQSKHFRERLNRIDEALANLPIPFEDTQLVAIQVALVSAADQVKSTDQSHLVALRDVERLEVLRHQAVSLAARRSLVQGRIAHVESELGVWNLFARCMSNDGLIALAIDDAGPALSGLTNDLLLACYGARFTVSIHTLVETGKGDQREGFDIVVHDAESGESKSVGLMSGGERVWVNECLTRAVALYLTQSSGRRYETLFSDEADGPLDADRKRMFMAMKREVLRLGGYEREFFVSQTPELTALADVVIDLDALVESDSFLVQRTRI